MGKRHGFWKIVLWLTHGCVVLPRIVLPGYRPFQVQAPCRYYHILIRLSTALFCCFLFIFSVYTLEHKLEIRGQGLVVRSQ